MAEAELGFGRVISDEAAEEGGVLNHIFMLKAMWSHAGF